ncbi:MAG TPA: hypothetical protein VMA09_02885 [Candidatus Binataceae bacterium]|nr:hypothetical protein [Candidatus Binataceae bacterium]
MRRSIGGVLLLVTFFVAGRVSREEVADGQAQLQQRHLDAAERDFRNALLDDRGAKFSYESGHTTADRAALEGLKQVHIERNLAKLTAEIQSDPSSDEYEERASFYAEQKQRQKQIADLKEAIRLDPSDKSAYQHLASAYLQEGDQQAALATPKEDIAHDQTDPLIFDSYAKILATSPSAKVRWGHEAVYYATRACELSGWHDTRELVTLGEAYAADGKFDEAIKWESAAEDIRWQEASVIFDPSAHPLKVPGPKLTLYRQHKPFIAEPDFPSNLR